MKRYRKVLGYSWIDLAGESGVSTSLIATIETGNKFPASVSVFVMRFR